ncbi:hypothetical protein LLG96_15345 [bacterium]|nr:hypothetical protein [bacterium]
MMRKYILFLMIIILSMYSPVADSEQTADFSKADSLYNATQYLQAIEEYSRFLNSDKADYALYRIGLSKSGIANFCVSDYQFDKYPEMYKKQYGDKYPLYIAGLDYINKHPEQFWYFESGAIHVYRGNDFKTIIYNYPKSDYVDDSAYELLLETRHIDWEGDYADMLPRIDRCKAFLGTYPKSELCDKVVDLCLDDYSNVITAWEVPDSVKSRYETEIKEFKRAWGRK